MNLANRLQQQQAEAIKPPTYTVPPAQRLSFGAYTPRDDAPSGAGTTNPVPTQNDLMAFLAQQQAKRKQEKLLQTTHYRMEPQQYLICSLAVLPLLLEEVQPPLTIWEVCLNLKGIT